MQIFSFLSLFVALSYVSLSVVEMTEEQILRREIQDLDQKIEKNIEEIMVEMRKCLLVKGEFEQLISKKENHKVVVAEKYETPNFDCEFRDFPKPVESAVDANSCELEILRKAEMLATNRFIHFQGEMIKIMNATLFYCNQIEILQNDKC
jgi:hypothetical protein